MITDKRLFFNQNKQTKRCCGGSIRRRHANNTDIKKAVKNKVSASEYLRAVQMSKK